MLITIIVLAAFGILMIAMEVILPGGILGILGSVAIGVALLLTFTSSDLDSMGTNGRLVLGGCILGGAGISLLLWLRYFTKAGFVKKHLLSSEIDGTQDYDRYQDLLDKVGKAETDLRPAGKARIDGKKHDVLAETGSIERGTDVKVVKVEGSKVVVRSYS